MKTFNSPSAIVPKELTETDHQSISELRKALESAILNSNADAIAGLCTDDVKLLHPNTPLITGKEAVKEHEAKVLEIVKVVRLELTPIEIYGIDNLVYEVGTQEVAIEPSDDRFLGKRKYVHILKKDVDRQWKFAVLMSNNSQ